MIGAPLSHRSLARLGIPAGLIFACAVILGWSAGDVIVPPPSSRPPSAWALPRPRTEDPARDFAAVMAGRPWNRGSPLGGGSQSRAPAVAAPASWRLAGIAQRGGEGFALIASGAAPSAKIDYARVGDRLPDSSVIVALTSDSITTKGGKESSASAHIYRLFGAKE
ncbi:MAG: hypothetical protein JO081_18075 [Alphaproteobacteria bacterium]|nr:hypothetical protein [Alphaproteobacteria bacterium]